MTNVKIYFTGEDGIIKDAEISSGELEKYLKNGFDVGDLNIFKPSGGETTLQINTVKGKNRRKVIPSNYIFKGVQTIGGAIYYHEIRTGRKLVVYVTERTERIAQNNKVLIE